MLMVWHLQESKAKQCASLNPFVMPEALDVPSRPDHRTAIHDFNLHHIVTNSAEVMLVGSEGCNLGVPAYGGE
jgi:hypothetical protein